MRTSRVVGSDRFVPRPARRPWESWYRLSVGIAARAGERALSPMLATVLKPRQSWAAGRQPAPIGVEQGHRRPKRAVSGASRHDHGSGGGAHGGTAARRYRAGPSSARWCAFVSHQHRLHTTSVSLSGSTNKWAHVTGASIFDPSGRHVAPWRRIANSRHARRALAGSQGSQCETSSDWVHGLRTDRLADPRAGTGSTSRVTSPAFRPW
jgi:hypothetical protein